MSRPFIEPTEWPRSQGTVKYRMWEVRTVHNWGPGSFPTGTRPQMDSHSSNQNKRDPEGTRRRILEAAVDPVLKVRARRRASRCHRRGGGLQRADALLLLREQGVALRRGVGVHVCGLCEEGGCPRPYRSRAS
ncbi:hypothetical protein BURKHO8Y_480104 [Burkholderia sp. 8Y]|nr:hypothetical protein BURKHO8Y_480104 [Burkholderia sp. 8Y]